MQSMSSLVTFARALSMGLVFSKQPDAGNHLTADIVICNISLVSRRFRIIRRPLGANLTTQISIIGRKLSQTFVSAPCHVQMSQRKHSDGRYDHKYSCLKSVARLHAYTVDGESHAFIKSLADSPIEGVEARHVWSGMAGDSRFGGGPGG